MFLFKYFVFPVISLAFVTAKKYDLDSSNLLDSELQAIKNLQENLLLIRGKAIGSKQDKVEIKLYYECLCPGCREFDTTQLRPTVEKLAAYLDLHIYPYGNAKTIDNGNGHYEFKCQHGEKECYGNKLHACAIDYLGDISKAVLFNACLMDFSQNNQGSDDEAADKCGKSMNIDSEKIKKCAKGPKGSELLKYYGDESQKAHYNYVPYVLFNGVEYKGNDLMADVCAALTAPPPECAR